MSESLAILVCNRKGGVGKTLVSTNLAALFAARNWRTVLLDCDSQQSAREWSQARRDTDRLTVIDAHANTGLLAPAIRLRIPPDAECLIYDAPAGASGTDLGDLLRRVRLVLVPVMPSALDLSATEGFMRDITRTREVRTGRVKIGLIVNRAREEQVSTRMLRDAVSRWEVPVVGELRDTQLYVFAAGIGKAVHELNSPRADRDRQSWYDIYDRIFKLSGAGSRATAAEPGTVSYLYPAQ